MNRFESTRSSSVVAVCTIKHVVVNPVSVLPYTSEIFSDFVTVIQRKYLEKENRSLIKVSRFWPRTEKETEM